MPGGALAKVMSPGVAVGPWIPAHLAQHFDEIRDRQAIAVVATQVTQRVDEARRERACHEHAAVVCQPPLRAEHDRVARGGECVEHGPLDWDAAPAVEDHDFLGGRGPLDQFRERGSRVIEEPGGVGVGRKEVEFSAVDDCASAEVERQRVLGRRVGDKKCGRRLLQLPGGGIGESVNFPAPPGAPAAVRTAASCPISP